MLKIVYALFLIFPLSTFAADCSAPDVANYSLPLELFPVFLEEDLVRRILDRPTDRPSFF